MQYVAVQVDAFMHEYGVKEGDHLTLLNMYNLFLDNRKNSAWCAQRGLNYRSLCRISEIRLVTLPVLYCCVVRAPPVEPIVGVAFPLQASAAPVPCTRCSGELQSEPRQEVRNHVLWRGH